MALLKEDKPSANVYIESPFQNANGFRRFEMRIKRTREIGKTLPKLLKGSGYESSRVEWICEDDVLDGSETIDCLEGKVVKFRLKS